MADANPTCVYLYFDRDEILIYVGVTGRGLARQREHERDKPWWSFTARQEIEHYATRAQALDRERSLIETFCPPFNTTHNQDVDTRSAYLALAEAPASAVQDAPGKRLALRIARADDDSLLAITTMADAALAASITVGADYVLAAAGRKAQSQVRRVGAAIAISVHVRDAADFAGAELMYRHGEHGRQLKRIDLTTGRS